jgi:hypothetical protein
MRAEDVPRAKAGLGGEKTPIFFCGGDCRVSEFAVQSTSGAFDRGSLKSDLSSQILSDLPGILRL